MFDELVRERFAGVAAPVARVCADHRITASQITWTGFVVALAAAAAIGTGHPWLGLSLWLVSRVADGLDGVVARISGQAGAFGGYLDLTLDMAAYSAMVIGFAVAHPEYGVMWVCTVTGYVLAVTTTLALSSAAERERRSVAGGNRTFQFTRGLAEAGETSVVYALWVVAPNWMGPVGWAWCALLAASVVQRSWLAWRWLRTS